MGLTVPKGKKSHFSKYGSLLGGGQRRVSAKSINHSLEVMVGNSTTSRNTRGMPEAQWFLTQIQESIYPDLKKGNSLILLLLGGAIPQLKK